jgi:hypothetical protein
VACGRTASIGTTATASIGRYPSRPWLTSYSWKTSEASRRASCRQSLPHNLGLRRAPADAGCADAVRRAAHGSAPLRSCSLATPTRYRSRTKEAARVSLGSRSRATFPATFCPQRANDPRELALRLHGFRRKPLYRNELHHRPGIWGAGGRGFEPRRPDGWT